MDFESVVMYYLAAEGLFLSPQFPIRAPSGGEWSCPDFVALDLGKRQVQVVEVTTGANVFGLIEKIRKRDHQWFQYLKPQLLARRVIDDSWTFVVRAFVREDNVELIRRKFLGEHDVLVESIEKIAFSWKWPWAELPLR